MKRANFSLVQSGALSVTVIDASTNLAIQGVDVSAAGPTPVGPTATNATGMVSFAERAAWRIQYRHQRHRTWLQQHTGVAVAPDTRSGIGAATTDVTVKLNPLPSAVTGTVTVNDPARPDNAAAVANATVTLSNSSGQVVATVKTNSSVCTRYSNVVAGTYKLQASATNYETSLFVIVLTRGNTTT